MEFVRAGDEVCVVRLIRAVGRTRDVLNLVRNELEAQGRRIDGFGAQLLYLRPTLGHLFVTVLGMVGQLERDFLRERQRAGIDAAKGRAQS